MGTHLPNPAGGLLSLTAKCSNSNLCKTLPLSRGISSAFSAAAPQPRSFCLSCSPTGRSPFELLFLKNGFTCNELSSHLIQATQLRLGQEKKLRRESFQVRARSPDDDGSLPQYSSDTKMRSEVISPFRAVRMFFYLAFIASGAVGSLITLTRFAAALGSASNAEPILDIFKDLGIDLAAVAIFSILYRYDARARDASLAKISREEILSTLRVELANKRVLTLQQLRGTARIVIISGPGSYIKESFRQGEPFKEALLDRGVLVVPHCLDGAIPASEPTASTTQQGGGSVAVQEQAKVATTDRWTATPIYTNEWSRWLNIQKKLANIPEDRPVYISLRLDGRVRGSGVGFPPWERFALQLPPLKGIWKGPLDGMDGRV